MKIGANSWTFVFLFKPDARRAASRLLCSGQLPRVKATTDILKDKLKTATMADGIRAAGVLIKLGRANAGLPLGTPEEEPGEMEWAVDERFI